MTDYSKWKIKKEELNNNYEEYGKVASWCNENGYFIKDTGKYYRVEKQNFVINNEMIENFRKVAYVQEVDPITAHIQRLYDEEQTEEIISEIEQLKEKRKQKVQEIKEKFPYNEELEN